MPLPPSIPPPASTTPFTDAGLISGALYATAHRLARRTSMLHEAKMSGADATATTLELAATGAPNGPVVCDIGCGRGTSTLGLARRLAPTSLIALDQSAALLRTVANRMERAGLAVMTVRADFHHLPLATASIDVAVAAFCLYHSSKPELAVADIARTLRPGGRAVLVTKSVDSYSEVDQLIARTGLDPSACTRPSLYQTFHGATAPRITAGALRIEQVIYQRHTFRFTGLDHLAAYLITSPKYQLRAHLAHSAEALAAALRARAADQPITTTSTLTYISSTRT